MSKYRTKFKHPSGVIFEVIASKWEAFENLTAFFTSKFQSHVFCWCLLINYNPVTPWKAPVVGFVQLWRKVKQGPVALPALSGCWGFGQREVVFSLWHSSHKNRSPGQTHCSRLHDGRCESLWRVRWSSGGWLVASEITDQLLEKDLQSPHGDLCAFSCTITSI